MRQGKALCISFVVLSGERQQSLDVCRRPTHNERAQEDREYASTAAKFDDRSLSEGFRAEDRWIIGATRGSLQNVLSKLETEKAVRPSEVIGIAHSQYTAPP
jgi:hypothetical protein